MLSFKPRQISENEIVEKIKAALDACDSSELKTKKFVGLLNDFIPYENGLKMRLELLAKAGYIDQIDKLKRDQGNDPKIEKMAQAFSKEYGFVLEESLNTIRLIMKAKAFSKVTRQNTPALKIVSAVQTQGNFSKKHLQSEPSTNLNTEQPEGKIQLNQSTPLNLEVKPADKAVPGQRISRKKWVRNKRNLISYLFLLMAIPIGYYTLLSNHGAVVGTIAILDQFFSWPIAFEPNVISLLIISGVMTLAPFVVNKVKKLNILGFYPLVLLGIEVILTALSSKLPAYFTVVQFGIGVCLFLSFLILGFYAMHLPKGAKEYTAYRSLLPYYLMTGLWLGAQYLILSKVVL
ncbi:MAG: hypothetical protein BGO41_08425 [Clostridiales bacterium 38-18]|nr:MAG: hypothetical protein BGO41_08425 [Clostridiales bacterium 38-18]